MLLMLAFGFTACGQSGANSSVPLIPEASAVVKDNSSSQSPANPTSPTAPATTSKGVALVFNGTGVCTDGCGQAGLDASALAGLTPKYVTGNELSAKSTAAEIDAFFANVKVWVMPGGYARNEYNAMSEVMRSALKNFIQGGGGYVGWCAGAFAATSIIGTTGADGFGLMAGSSAVYKSTGKKNSYGASIEKTTWFNGTRNLYLEGGPYFYNLPSSVEVVGRYDDNVSVSAVRSSYGNGRVYLTGPHPEAPSWWFSGTGITDADGSDLSYAAEMIKWAAKLSN